MKITKLTIALLLIGTTGAINAMYQDTTVEVNVSNDVKFLGKIYVSVKTGEKKNSKLVQSEVEIGGVRQVPVLFAQDALNKVCVYTQKEGDNRTDRDVYKVMLSGKGWDNATHSIVISKDKLSYTVTGYSMHRTEEEGSQGMKMSQQSQQLTETKEFYPIHQTFINGKWQGEDNKK